MSNPDLQTNPIAQPGTYYAVKVVAGAVGDLNFRDGSATVTMAGSTTAKIATPCRRIRIGTVGSGNLSVRMTAPPGASVGCVAVLTKLRAGDVIDGLVDAVFASGSDVQDVAYFF